MRLRLLLFFNSMLLFTAVLCEEEIKERVLNRREFDASPSIEQQTIQEFSQNSTAAEASFDDVIEEIIDSSHQGRSIEGLDEVYSDPTVKQALLNGDDSQARNLIRDKLCSLGLMECEKRAPVRYIYTQPPPGPIYAQRPGNRPPQISSQNHYGQPRPVPLPGNFPPQQPPRKVGYAPSNLNNFQYSKPIGEKYAMEFFESESAPSSVKFGYTEKPTIIVNQGKREVGQVAGGVSQNHHVHHHYVHVDGAAAPIDASKILVNTPISEYSAVNSLAGSYQTSGFGQNGGNSAGGFSPSASDFEYKGVNSGSQGVFNGASESQAYNGASQGIYGGASTNVKPVFESSQFSSGANYNQQTNQLNTGPPQFNDGSNGIYNVGSSYHAGAPDFYKKELNVNGNRGNGLAASQFYNQQQKQQFNTQKYSKNQYNQGEKYQGFESARQDQFDCVCVPFEQCPAQDVVGRRDDLILPLDPRHLSTEIEADDNSTVSRVTKDVDAKNTTEVHKIKKRQVNDPAKVQGEGRLFGFGGPPIGHPPPGYPGYPGGGFPGVGGFGKKVVPTLGVSFGLPFPTQTGYPISPYGNPINNPHFGALTPNGLNLGLLNVNPLFSFQVTKSEHGEKLLKPFVNLHLSPSENIIGKIGSLIAHKKAPQHQHFHKHLHRYPHAPPFLPFDPHHHHFEGPGLPFPPHFDGPIYPHPPHHHFDGPILHHPQHHPHFLDKPSLIKKFKHQKELLFEDIALNTDLLGLRSSGELDSAEDSAEGGYLSNINEVENPESLQHFPPFDQNGNSLQHFPPFNPNGNQLQNFPPIGDERDNLPRPTPPAFDNSIQEYAANAQRINTGFTVKPPNSFKFDDLQSNPNDIRYARQFNNYDQSSNQNIVQSIPAQAPGSAEGSAMVSFPTSRRRRDTDQVVPASIEKKEDLESVEGDTSDENEGRALSAEKRQAFYQQSLQQPKQCGPRAVCCRKPNRAPHQQQPLQQQQSFQQQQLLQQPFQQQNNNKFNRCGVRNAQGINGRIKNPSYIDGDSEFGEYPWQAAILKKDPKESVYVCGGTLIDNSHIITAAHCVKTYSGFDLRVRLGEWDVNHDVEFFPYVERDVISVHVHPEYYAGTLDNDLAILKLSQPVDFSGTPHISPACLPDKFSDFTRQRCWTTGWGKDNWEYGKYQNILKEVDVPVIDQNTCQQQLRQTRLGYSYQLNPGFLCAGGEEGKDACKGDGGGPLVCERNGVWQVAGIVSWGIGCGKANVPGVYVRVAHYLDWIGSITQRY